ncbi:HNH endonuclease [Luteibacter sp. SG786]|uniref:HNH endonuclease n=1 Tax=Luteibacter sp. SG786 TaxID=2587130 RepID=UPI0024959031|nr:HNH endonuclease [Luteibacter sp. SG786]
MLRCTAEHLTARQDGGRNMASNIAAACWICNARRHRRKFPPPPAAYRAFVQQRLDKGKWHPPALAPLCSVFPPARG